MTADLLQQERRPADGSRPLVVGRPVEFLEPALLEHVDGPLPCYYAARPDALAAGCLREIQPGEHYLRHDDRDGDDVPTGHAWSYCAPCAIREAHWWAVREAAS